jgi:threonine dehydratase
MAAILADRGARRSPHFAPGALAASIAAVTELDMALVADARRALDGQIRRTPIEASPALSDAAGVPVFLKLEALQLTGSFKIRGAWFVLSRLTADERRHGLVTC